jgi:streptogramin lyase
MRRAFRLLIEFFSAPTAFAGDCAARQGVPARRMGSRFRQRNVFSTVRGGRRGIPAVLASAGLAALGCSNTASGAESPRGLHVISMGNINPFAVVLADDGTPWFTASKDLPVDGGADLVIHVTADGRVVRYHLPKSDPDSFSILAWGADGALWAVDDAIGGLIRVTPDGRYTRFRDGWATPETLDETGLPSIIAGPDGRLWLGDRAKHRIVSVAADGSLRVVATLGGRAEPDLLATGPDGSVWFTQVSGKGLRRVLPDGGVEAVRYPNSDVPSASVAPNGDVWFIVNEDFVKRTGLVRIDREVV